MDEHNIYHAKIDDDLKRSVSKQMFRELFIFHERLSGVAITRYRAAGKVPKIATDISSIAKQIKQQNIDELAKAPNLTHEEYEKIGEQLTWYNNNISDDQKLAFQKAHLARCYNLRPDETTHVGQLDKQVLQSENHESVQNVGFNVAVY